MPNEQTPPVAADKSPDTQTTVPTSANNVWALVGYFFVIYLIFLAVVVVGYPLAQKFALPITSLIVPTNENNSMMKNVLVTTGMYWSMVAGYWWFVLRQPK